jgi:hypothetical protein
MWVTGLFCLKLHSGTNQLIYPIKVYQILSGMSIANKIHYISIGRKSGREIITLRARDTHNTGFGRIKNTRLLGKRGGTWLGPGSLQLCP